MEEYRFAREWHNNQNQQFTRKETIDKYALRLRKLAAELQFEGGLAERRRMQFMALLNQASSAKTARSRPSLRIRRPSPNPSGKAHLLCSEILTAADGNFSKIEKDTYLCCLNIS